MCESNTFKVSDPSVHMTVSKTGFLLLVMSVNKERRAKGTTKERLLNIVNHLSAIPHTAFNNSTSEMSCSRHVISLKPKYQEGYGAESIFFFIVYACFFVFAFRFIEYTSSGKLLLDVLLFYEILHLCFQFLIENVLF